MDNGTGRGRKQTMNQKMEAMEHIKDVKQAYLTESTKLLAMTSAVSARTWRSHAAAVAARNGCKTTAQIAKATGKGRTASLPSCLEMNGHGRTTCTGYKKRGSMGKNLLERGR